MSVLLFCILLVANCQWSSSYSPKLWRLTRTNALARKEDFIDAEIVSEPKKDKPKFFPPKEPKKEKEGGGLLKSVFNGIAKVFGQDKKSIAKRQRRREAETAIDRVFEGTGLMGGLLGGLMKGMGSMLAEMMEESAGDLSSIQDKVVSSLTADSACSSYLGEDIACGAPFQSSSSSSSINGVVNKYYAYVMQVEGNRNAGNVKVQATVGTDGVMRITELVFQGNDGRLINLRRNSGSSGSGGYIDVDPL